MRSKNKRWLYLPVEIKVRELEAKLLLAYYAAKQGYRVVLGEHRMVELASGLYPKGIFFSKGYPFKIRNRIISTAHKHGHKVVELDEEGLIIKYQNHYFNDRMHSNMLQLVAQEYCWGALQKEIIKRNANHFEKKCFITGNPRFDLLKPKFQPLFEDDVVRLQKSYGNFILINTRFSGYNSLLGFQTSNEHQKYLKTLYDRFIAMTVRIAKQFPHTNIIIRPHPSENKDSYKSAVSSLQNVHVVHEGNIVKWLIAASAIIHNGCTTSIEAFLLNKPVISYLPITSDKYDVPLPNKLGHLATNDEDVINLLDSILNEKPNLVNEEQLRYLMNYCDWSPNDYSCENILSLLNKLELPPATYLPTFKKSLHEKQHRYVLHFFPFLTKHEIETFFRKLDGIENSKSRFNINSLGKNIFCIESPNR